MKFKSCPASLKTPDAADFDDPGAGEFDALVSVFGNVDAMGDVVMPGAFTDTLTAWKNSPDTMPVLWSHRVDDPAYNIGAVVEAEEIYAGDERIPAWASPHVHSHGGLWIKGLIDVGPDASAVARHARKLLAARRVTQFSYAYDVIDEGPDEHGNNELRKLWLHECSPTQVGANQLTELAGAKADPAGTPAVRRPGFHPDVYRRRCELYAARLTLAAG
jgi:uncharacterized protein